MTGQGPVFHPDTGLPQAMARKCATCVFRPGNPMRLRPGRLGELVDHNRGIRLPELEGLPQSGGVLTCHMTLSYGTHPELGQSACRGYLDAYPDVLAARIAERLLGGWHLIDPPTEES